MLKKQKEAILLLYSLCSLPKAIILGLFFTYLKLRLSPSSSTFGIA